MQTLVDAIRSTGARQPVIATGLGWGSDLSSWLRYRPRDPAHQLVAGLHAYDFRFCATHSCWRGQVGVISRAAPVVTTELGQKACSSTFLARFLNWADSAGVSYLGWTWNPVGCGAPALIRSWDGKPTASGQKLRVHLKQLLDPGRLSHILAITGAITVLACMLARGASQ